MSFGFGFSIVATRGLSLAQRAIALLRSLGTSAHVWLPGANGVSVASLPSNNYLLSDGSTGYSTVDGVVGLDLDGMGSLGSELVGTYDFTTYGTAGGVSARTTNTFTTTSAGGVLTVNGLISLGVTYTITVTGTTTATQIYLRNPSTLTNSTAASTGAFTLTLTCAWTDVANIYLMNTTAGFTTITSFSCKPYTGTHLTQPTTANKPLVRRGMLNLLTYSLDVSNDAWPATNWTNAASDILSPTGDSSGRKLTATAVGAPLLRTDKVATSTTQTFVFVFKDGTYTTPRFVFRNATTATILVDVSYAGANSSGSSAYGTYEFTDYRSNGWKICRITCTSGITIGNSLGLYFGAGGTITNGLYFYAWGGGLFDGAWTAAQIVAEGGITSTTTTAASNPSAGKYWWSFDGSNDSLLSGNLGITNACTIVIAGRVNTLPANTVLFGEDANGVQISMASNGEVSFTKKSVVILVTTAAWMIVAGVPFVLTCRLSAGTAVIRKLGTQVATAATAQVFAATTGARIGTAFDGTSFPTNGAFGWVVALPVALSDADCLTVERLVGSQFPGMATF